jgi:hypothetical protein
VGGPGFHAQTAKQNKKHSVSLEDKKSQLDGRVGVWAGDWQWMLQQISFGINFNLGYSYLLVMS